MARNAQGRKPKAKDLGVIPEVMVGIDLSLNGPAMVALSRRRGFVVGWGFVTNEKKFVERIDGRTKKYDGKVYVQKNLVLPREKGEDIDSYESRRRYCNFIDIWEFLVKVAQEKPNNIIVGMEDYAVGKVGSGGTQRILQIAELAGCIKNNLYHYGVSVRTYAPAKVKAWATGNNCAKKIQMVQAAVDLGFSPSGQYNEKGPKFNPPVKIGKKVYQNEFKGPGTDLADAFHVARLLRIEWILKSLVEPRFEMFVEGMGRDKLKYFTSKTKANPVCLLEKPFIQRKAVSDDFQSPPF